MNGNIRKVFDDLDTVLMGLSMQDRMGVLSVLGAIRGPDAGQEQLLKAATTCVIRTAALPKVFHPGAFNSYLATNQSRQTFLFRDAGESHFLQHANAAARVLGLIKEKAIL